MAAVDLTQLLQWINHAVKGASFSSLQSAITPHALLLVLSQIVPATHEPSLATVSLDELGAVTVFCNACRRLGMRFLFAPADLLELSGRARLPDDSPAGGGFAAVLACLSELFAISRARGSADLVDASYAALGTAGRTPPLDPTLRLTYAEHEALYTGVLPCTMSASARVRLWQVSISASTGAGAVPSASLQTLLLLLLQYVLCFEPEAVVSQACGRAAAGLAARRVSEAKRRAAAGTPDDLDACVHALHSPGVGTLLLRRRLVRSLVRAGVPPFARGYLWCRWSGLLEREALGLLRPADVAHLVTLESDAKRGPNFVASCRLCGASAPPCPSPVYPTPCVHALVPAVVPELSVPPPHLAAQHHPPPPFLLSEDREKQPATAAYAHATADSLGYYSLCVLANRESLGARDDGLPPRLTQFGGEIAVIAWRGRRLFPAPPSTVRQIDADLRRTTPHMWPIEAARITPRSSGSRVDTAALDQDAAIDVNYVFAPRAECWCRCLLLETPAGGGCGGSASSSLPCRCCNCSDPAVRCGGAPPALKPREAADVTLRQDGLGRAMCPGMAACQFRPVPPTSEFGQRSPLSLEPSLRVAVTEAACRRVLLAFATHNPSVDYCQGLNFLVAHALRWCSEPDAFALLTALVHRILPPAYFDGALAGAARDQAILAELLLSQAVPGLLEHLAKLSGLTAGPKKGHMFENVLPTVTPSGSATGRSASSLPVSPSGSAPLALIRETLHVPSADEVLSDNSSKKRGSRAPGIKSPSPPAPLPDAGALLQAADTLSGMTLKFFMCLFTLPFHAAFTDRVWDSLLFEGVHSLSQCSIARGALAGSCVASADGEGIYWPTTPRRVLSLKESDSSPPSAGEQRLSEPPRYGCGLRTVVANPSGSYANKTLFKVALALLRLAAPKMLVATSFGDALMVLDGLAVSTSKPRVHSAMFDVWVWPSESSAASAAASTDVPHVKHGAVTAHIVESVSNDASDAVAVPPDAAAASDTPGATSPPQHLRLSSQAAAEAANVAALSAVIDAHLRVSGRTARRSHRGPAALQAGAAAAASSVAESAAFRDGYLVGMGFGVDAAALEWLASTSQGATAGAGRSRSNVGVGPTFGGASRSRRATGRPAVLLRQGSRTAVALLRVQQQLQQQQQPRDVTAGALDCSLDDAQVDVYELAQADAGGATAADPSRAGQGARIGTGARPGAPVSPLASRKPTPVAPLPPRRAHPHAHWHLVPKHHQSKAPPQPTHLAKPEKVPLDGGVAGTAAGAVHAPVTPPSTDGSSTAPALPLLPPALVLARATKPLVWREGLHVRRQWVQSRRAFLTAAAATHDAAVAAVVASIDADVDSWSGSVTALVSLLHAAALHPVLEGGGGEHAPRCNVDLAAEAAAEEGTLRAEALRVRDRAAAARKSGYSDPPHLAGSEGAALAEEAHADLGNSRGDSEAADEDLDRDDCDRASGPHDASGLDCSSILSDSGHASDAGREHDGADVEEDGRGDGEEEDEDPALERAQGHSARSVARLSDARVPDELAEAALPGLDDDAGATVHLRIGPQEAAAPPRRSRGGGGVAAFGASPRLLLAHDPHVPPVCTTRSPGGPQGELCASSHRLWSFFYRLELDGQRPFPCGGGGPALREDYFPAVHVETTTTAGGSRAGAERGGAQDALLSSSTLQHIFGAAPTLRRSSPALASARADDPTATPEQLRHGSPGSDLPIALLLMPGSDSGLGVPAQSEGRSLRARGGLGGSVGTAASPGGADPSRDYSGYSGIVGTGSPLSPAHSSSVVRLQLAAAGDDAPDTKGELKLTDRSPEAGRGGGGPRPSLGGSGVGSAGPERAWWADRAAVSDVAAALAETRGGAECHPGGDASSPRPMRRVESRLLTELLPHPETPPPPCQPDGSSSSDPCTSPAAIAPLAPRTDATATPPAGGVAAQPQSQLQPAAFASSAPNPSTEPGSALSPSQQRGGGQEAEFRPRLMTAAVYARAAAYAALPPALLGHAVLPEYLLLGGLGGSHIVVGGMATTPAASASGPAIPPHAAATD